MSYTVDETRKRAPHHHADIQAAAIEFATAEEISYLMLAGELDESWTDLAVKTYKEGLRHLSFVERFQGNPLGGKFHRMCRCGSIVDEYTHLGDGVLVPKFTCGDCSDIAEIVSGLEES